MEGISLDTAVQVITIAGGAVALLLATLQLVDTWLDIGEKLRKRQEDVKKQQAGRAKKNGR